MIRSRSLLACFKRTYRVSPHHLIRNLDSSIWVIRLSNDTNALELRNGYLPIVTAKSENEIVRLVMSDKRKKIELDRSR
jgi:hypothetical protein